MNGWLVDLTKVNWQSLVGESLMVLTNRQGTKAKKGDPIWQRGVFLGKTENNLFITWHMDGIKTS